MPKEKEQEKNNQIIIYNTEDGEMKIKVKVEDDTVWLSQKQMAELFNKDVRTVNEHIKNVFFEGELAEDSTIRKFRIVQKEILQNAGNVSYLEMEKKVREQLKKYNDKMLLKKKN